MSTYRDYPNGPYLPTHNDVLVRVGSHRAAYKLAALLGFRPRDYKVWGKPSYYSFVPSDRLAEVLAVKGISKARMHPDLMGCIY